MTVEKEVGYGKWVEVDTLERHDRYRLWHRGKVIECGRWQTYKYRLDYKNRWVVDYHSGNNESKILGSKADYYLNYLTSRMYDAKYSILLSSDEEKLFRRLAQR